MESVTSTSTVETSQGGQQEQEQQGAEQSSSSSSNQGEGVIINQENNKNEGSVNRFVVDDETTAKFGPRAKTKVSVLKEPFFPKARQTASEVSKKRARDFVDKVDKRQNGKNAIDVEIPLNLANNDILVMIEVNYQQALKAITYNREKGIVICSDSALTTICKDAGGLASLDSEEKKVIDELLAKHLEKLIRSEENTKSALELLEELEESNSIIDQQKDDIDKLKGDINKLKGDKKALSDNIKQLNERMKKMGDSKENNATNNSEDRYREWCEHRDRFMDEQDRLRIQQSYSYPLYQQQSYPIHQHRGNSSHYQSSAASSSSAASGNKNKRGADDYGRRSDYHSDSSDSNRKHKTKKHSKRSRSRSK